MLLHAKISTCFTSKPRPPNQAPILASFFQGTARDSTVEINGIRAEVATSFATLMEE